ncbi:Fe-S cluster assembly protein SufD [Blattabacterium cuenoti]|uniref:Fe-S cluster assembly protein SufD n=1 Tax=Blattabacterium cuenoti TaxID=1653831 RepID=UPI00163B89CA|nr:Fe-S cluster assembly protein SufD [Blattabacterium cuenoti]
MQLKEKIIFSLKNFSYENNKKKNSHIYSLQEKDIFFFKKKGFDSIYKDKEYSYLHTILNQEYDFISKRKIENSEEYEKIKEKIPLKSDNSFFCVFVDGIPIIFSKNNNDIILSNIYSQQESLIKDFYGKLSYNKKYNVFNTINNIFSDGAFIYIPNNILLKKPIEIVYITTGIVQKLMINIRNLIVVGKGSSVKIIEYHKCLKKNSSLINIVNEIYALDNSNIDYYKIQDKLKDSFVIDNTFFKQKKNSKCSIYTFSFQGKIIRNNLKFYSHGENAYSYLYGVSLLSEKQIIDNNTYIDHLYSNSYSYQLYKKILWGESQGIFNGKIFINKFLKGINAFQKNNNILLSNRSYIYARPQLEIYSENVKCSHGCTIGNIQESELFYLQSRGIPEKEANILLLLSFLEEILKSVDIYIKKIIYDKIKKKLDKLNL